MFLKRIRILLYYELQAFDIWVALSKIRYIPDGIYEKIVVKAYYIMIRLTPRTYYSAVTNVWNPIGRLLYNRFTNNNNNNIISLYLSLFLSLPSPSTVLPKRSFMFPEDVCVVCILWRSQISSSITRGQ